MPPKAKFTREEVIGAALEIVKRDGIEVLTARSLAAELGSSPRPIFTVFESMEEVLRAVTASAVKLYEKYEDEGMEGLNSFKGAGTGYIRFASEQPKLFQLLFMKERCGFADHKKTLTVIDNYYEKILNLVQKQYGFSRETSEEIYMHMWIYSHGIASLIATNVCSFSEKAISEMITDVCSGIIRKYKAEGRL